MLVVGLGWEVVSRGQLQQRRFGKQIKAIFNDRRYEHVRVGYYRLLLLFTCQNDVFMFSSCYCLQCARCIFRGGRSASKG